MLSDPSDYATSTANAGPPAEMAELGDMTPVVEVETPLLSAPDTAEILKQTKIEFLMEGMTLILLEENHDARSDPVRKL